MSDDDEYKYRSDGASPLYVAAEDGNEVAVKRILAKIKTGFYRRCPFVIGTSPCVDEEREGGSWPLLVAASLGHNEIVKELINAGATLDKARVTDKLTPLFIAVQEDKKDVVDTLIEAMRDASLLDEKKFRASLNMRTLVTEARGGGSLTPLEIAVALGNPVMVLKLCTALEEAGLGDVVKDLAKLMADYTGGHNKDPEDALRLGWVKNMHDRRPQSFRIDDVLKNERGWREFYEQQENALKAWEDQGQNRDDFDFARFEQQLVERRLELLMERRREQPKEREGGGKHKKTKHKKTKHKKTKHKKTKRKKYAKHKKTKHKKTKK